MALSSLPELVRNSALLSAQTMHGACIKANFSDMSWHSTLQCDSGNPVPFLVSGSDFRLASAVARLLHRVPHTAFACVGMQMA